MAFSECFFRCLYLVRSAFFPILRAIFEGVPGVVEGSLWSHLKAKKICFSANKKFFAYDLGNPLKNRPQKRLFSDPPISDFSNFDHFWPKCQKSEKIFKSILGEKSVKLAKCHQNWEFVHFLHISKPRGRRGFILVAF